MVHSGIAGAVAGCVSSARRITNAAGAHAGYDAELTPRDILDLTIRGVWTKDEVDRFFAALTPLYREARRRSGTTRTLVIVETVQSPAIALHVSSHALALKQPGDRRAFVVASFLSKLQIRRLATTDAFGLFTDRSAAERWLLS